MLWIVPMIVALAGAALLVLLALRAQREVSQTNGAIDTFQRALQPALLRVRDETARTRRRIPSDPR
jgi:hypothetical protein